MNDGPRQLERLRPERVRTLLDRLDARTRPPGTMELRLSRRFAYRAPALAVEFAGLDGISRRCPAASRNISRDGLGLLVGQFVYPGTPCDVALVSQHGRALPVRGRVVRCRYLVGSEALYDVGVRFERPVNVALFAPRAHGLHILLVHEDTALPHVIAGFLADQSVELTCATTAADALHTARGRTFDLLLLDLESAAFDGLAITQELRRAGYVEPIVGLAIEAGGALHARCVDAGCTGYLTKPITRDALRELVESLVAEPVISSVGHDPALIPLVDQFAGGLRERIRQMSRAFAHSDLSTVVQIVRGLRADAGSYGFEVISVAAANVQTLIASGAAGNEIQPALYDLIHLCLAARPASSPPDPSADSAGVLEVLCA